MYYFCTYFDQHYLPRGLALYRSLREHCPAFTLWILCMDTMTYEILENLALPGLHPIALEEFERDDAPLQSAKQNRSRIEYYFTCTPSLPLYVLHNWPEVDLITYLDADLFFFASPVPLFEELGTGSIAIIGHRFSPHLRHLEKFGIYNVGWLSFRRDENALTCLRWWRERCLEWCYDRLEDGREDGRFADQKYLDDWPSRFRNVVVLEHKGANLALWNVSNYRLSSLQGNTVMVANQPLIFFHVHGLQKIREWFYNPNWEMYDVVPSMVLRRKIYAYYIKVLFDTRCLFPLSLSRSIANGIREPAPVEDVSRISSIQRLVRKCRTRAILGQGLLKGKYFCVIHGYVI